MEPQEKDTTQQDQLGPNDESRRSGQEYNTEPQGQQMGGEAQASADRYEDDEDATPGMPSKPGWTEPEEDATDLP